MALDPRRPLVRIEQETAALTRRWGELRQQVVALAMGEAEPTRTDDDDTLALSVRAAIVACDQAQAGLLALDAERRGRLGQPPDRGHVVRALSANRTAWLSSTRLKLTRHADRLDHAADEAFRAGHVDAAAGLIAARNRLELAALVLREAEGEADDEEEADAEA